MAKSRVRWTKYFLIVEDYESAFMGDIDIYLIKDKSTNEFLKDKDGHISKWYSRNEAEKAAKELSKDKIFEEIVLLNK